MSTLKIALDLATAKHFGQFDKGGQPYIEHPVRVSNSMINVKGKIVALLHDVVEDTDCTFSDLYELGFDQEIIKALICLTKGKGESRISAAHRAAANRLACEVKLADVADNMDLSRIPNPSEKDYLRVEEYKLVKAILEDAKVSRWNGFCEKGSV